MEKERIDTYETTGQYWSEVSWVLRGERGLEAHPTVCRVSDIRICLSISSPHRFGDALLAISVKRVHAVLLPTHPLPAQHCQLGPLQPPLRRDLHHRPALIPPMSADSLARL